MTYVPGCTCGPDRIRGEETGPSKNPHNSEQWPRQFHCDRCKGVFSDGHPEPGHPRYREAAR